MKKIKHFILSYKRKKIKTAKMLISCGVDIDDIYVIKSTDDPITADDMDIIGFKKENVIFFEKRQEDNEYYPRYNENTMKSPLYGRNEIIRYCKKNEIEYFGMYDDDYSGIEYATKKITNFYKKIEKYIINILDTDDRLAYFCFTQNGQTIDRYHRNLSALIWRMAMNVFFAKTENAEPFRSPTNNDVCMNIELAAKGKFCICIPFLSIIQEAAHKKAKNVGMNEIYNNNFFVSRYPAVMASPGSVKIKYNAMVGRTHHSVKTNNIFPKLIINL
jgi:hypothetical protein